MVDDVVVVVIRKELPDDAAIELMRSMKHLRELFIIKRDIDESDVQKLGKLKQLRLLYWQFQKQPHFARFKRLSRELPGCHLTPFVLIEPESR